MHYQPLCNHQKKAMQLCIAKDCKFKNCFSCPDCKKMHSKKCQFMQYKKFIFQLHKKQGLFKPQFIKYQQKIQQTFNSLIKALKNQFIQFREQFQRLNAPQQILEFYNIIKNNDQNSLTGERVRPLLNIPQPPKNLQYKLRNQIQMKQLQNQIFEVHSYVIKKLRPYYSLSQRFQQIQLQTPDINQIKMIEAKFIDRKDVKQGLLKGDLKYFQKLLGETPYNIQMIYKASSNNFSIRKFHQKVDGRSNFLIMVKTQFGKVLGLWCPYKFSSPQKWQYIKGIQESFMFSMQKQLKGMKFQPVKLDFSIGLHKDYGPILGDDFVLFDKANTSRGCWSNFPDVYNCKDKPLPHTSQVIQTFIGVKDHYQRFNLAQWEVYKISLDRDEDLQASWMKIYMQI